MKLEDLDGVGPVTIKKLNLAGVETIMDLVVRGPVELAQLTGMEKDSANKIVNTARQFLMDNNMIMKDFTDGFEVRERRKNIGRIANNNCFFLKGKSCTSSIFL